jgi:cytochrome bd-type quinol oxidase subunit 1
MNSDTKRIFQVLFNPVAQSKFVHTVSAGYVTGAIECFFFDITTSFHGFKSNTSSGPISGDQVSVRTAEIRSVGE